MKVKEGRLSTYPDVVYTYTRRHKCRSLTIRGGNFMLSAQSGYACQNHFSIEIWKEHDSYYKHDKYVLKTPKGFRISKNTILNALKELNIDEDVIRKVKKALSLLL